MSDKRRRYLAQQAELGGSEVILSSEFRIPSSEASSPEPRGARPEIVAPVVDARVAAGGAAMSGEAAARAEALGIRVSGPGPSASEVGKWRKGAPPIPGPGLAIELPVRPLIGDPLAALESLAAVAETIRGCRKCVLCEGRSNTVPGEGNPSARLMLIGEGPGETEDRTGRPFVGRAGELLDSILLSIDIARESVYIANIVKCRPPQNRKPLPDEAAACLPYLHRQIELIRPKVIVALGGTAAENLLGARKSLGELRGRVHTLGGIPLVATYHPAALLRNPNWKKPTWDDIRIARQLLDR